MEALGSRIVHVKLPPVPRTLLIWPLSRRWCGDPACDRIKPYMTLEMQEPTISVAS